MRFGIKRDQPMVRFEALSELCETFGYVAELSPRRQFSAMRSSLMDSHTNRDMHQVRPRLHKSRTLVVTDGKSLNLILTWVLDSTQPHENVLGICLELTDMSTLTRSGRLRQ